MLVDHLQKTKKESRNLKKQEDIACFQYGMAYGDFKDLARKKASDKIVRDKAFNIAKNPKYDRNQRCVASMVYNFFAEKLLAEQLKIRIFQAKN